MSDLSKFLFFIFIFLIFIIGTPPLISADFGDFRQNSDIFLRANSNGTSVNISVFYPNSSVAVNNQPMTNLAGNIWNYTFSATEILGAYGFSYCNQDGNNCVDETFTITADGEPYQVFPLQFSFIILGFILVFISYFNERLSLFRSLGSILLMVMGIITLYPGYSFINHSTLMGLALGSILIVFGFYFLIEDSFSREEQSDHYDQEEEDEK